MAENFDFICKTAIFFPTCLYGSATKKTGETDCPRDFYQDHHRPIPNDIVTFYRRRTDYPGTGDKVGIAIFYQEHSHAGWIRAYELQRFQARRTLERSLGRHIRGRIVSIGQEYRWEEGGGVCSEGVVRIELVEEEEIETTDAESSSPEEVPEYGQHGYSLRARKFHT